MKFKVGQVWENGLRELITIDRINEDDITYPVVGFGEEIFLSYSKEGYYDVKRPGLASDLKRLVTDVGEPTPTTSALKNDKKDNKVPVENLRMAHISEMLKVFEWANAKYPDQENGDPNYYLGHSKKQLVAAAIRHWLAILDGEDTDPESGLHHVGHAMCCGAMYMKQLELKTLRENK